ncbi:MAG: GNAT family N-acetyltransferase [Acidobacteria bacterium]|nr:GNAT family N-acetyltransferase [Acidobacteriota bacterium]
MTTADVGAIIDLQMAFLEGSIVTRLGKPFLAAFHHAALGHPSTRAFVATDADGKLGGFAVASVDVAAFNSHTKRRVLWPLVQALLTPRGMRLMWRFARSLVEPDPEPYMPAELLLLVVDARYRRRGLGQQLLAAIEQAFARDGVSRYRVAVRSQLAVARAFYLATGFEAEQELFVLGRPMTYLIKRVAR